MSAGEVVATVLLVVGVLIELFAVLGLVVMRDAFDRLHYVGLAGYGALAIAVAILVRESWSLIGDKALATAALLLLIGPGTGPHHGPQLPDPSARRLAGGNRRGRPAQMTVLQAVALVAVALGGGAVVLTPDALRQTMVLGIYGISLTFLFFVFQAPDVALSEIVVTGIGLPLIILAALRKIRQHEHRRKRTEKAAGDPGAGRAREPPRSAEPIRRGRRRARRSAGHRVWRPAVVRFRPMRSTAT